MRNSSPEPAQRGERRILLHGPIDRQYFTFAYPAPAASNPDVPAFLLMQQLLGAGSGFNFNQNDWGTAAEAGSLLHGVTDDIATWFIPTAARYIFTIKGSLDRKGDQSQLEREIERRLQSLARPTPDRRTAGRREGRRASRASRGCGDDRGGRAPAGLYGRHRRATTF